MFVLVGPLHVLIMYRTLRILLISRVWRVTGEKQGVHMVQGVQYVFFGIF